MLEFAKNFFRRRALVRYSSPSASRIIPVSRVSTAAVFFDVDSLDFEACRQEVIQYFRSKGIKADLFFQDFRKLEKNELLITSIQNTIIRKNLNWYGMPQRTWLEALSQHPYDLYVSLVKNPSFANVLVSAAVPATFKVGLESYEGHPFNMVCSEGSVLEGFKLIETMLEKIED